MKLTEIRQNEARLLPCPFCGDQPVLIRDGQRFRAVCESLACKVEVTGFSVVDPENAIAAWNDRVPKPIAATGCIFECRSATGGIPTGVSEANFAWCRTHGFDCPNLRGTVSQNPPGVSPVPNTAKIEE